MTATTQAERQRKQQELDSILDAALDELDEESDNEEDRADYRGQNNSGGVVGDAADRINGDAAPTGVPYSLEYLASNEQRQATRRLNRPQFGPEPPQPPSASPFDLDSGEFAASLEGMMKQFTEGLGAVGLDNTGSDFDGMPELGDAVLADVFQKMMASEGTDGGGPSAATSAVGVGGAEMPRSNTNSQPQHQQHSTGGNGITPSVPPPAPSTKGNNSNGSTTPRKNNKKQPNVDESINRLLDGINQASSNPMPNLNAPPPGMEDVDPAKFEKMGAEMMSSLMKDFEKFGQANDSNDVVDGVMKQLLDKELMYEPMREVCLRFPRWLAENKDSLTPKEYQRHGTQYQYFQRIVHVYETEPDNFPRLMELMQDIQEYGQPPPDIIKELAPDLEFDAEGVPVMDPTGGGGIPGMMRGGMPFPGGGNEQCRIS